MHSKGPKSLHLIELQTYGT